jgi:peroxiredoxin
MKPTFLTLFLLALQIISKGQTVPDFTVVDTDGKIHSLYDDYLNKGKIVVLKAFFVDCPPCNSVAPRFQEKYVKWGEGKDRVQFIEMSTKLEDRNRHVIEYKGKHSLTFPSISADGGAFDAIKPYINGTLGSYSGTPLFVVITPDKKYTYDVIFSQIDNFIEAGLLSNQEIKPAKLSFKIDGLQTVLPGDVNLILTNDTLGIPPRYNITQLTGGTNTFDYPSQKFPKLTKPIIILESKAKAIGPGVNVSDLVLMKNHILGTNLLTTEAQKVAADVNGSGTINASDLVVLQRVILQVVDEFPNATPSYKILPEKIPVNFTSGSTNEIKIELIKIGNIK